MENELEERSSLESILDYAQTLWRWAWLLLLAGLAAGAVTFYITNQQPRTYQSSTRVMVNAGSSTIYENYYTSYYSQTLAETYAQTMATKSMLATVEERQGYKIPGSVKVSQVATQPLIDILVTDTDPQRAADIANMLVTVFSEKVISDQQLRYADLKTSLETEMAQVDEQLTAINERLAVLEIKQSEFEEAQRIEAAQRAAGLNPTVSVKQDPADIVERTQLELSQSQYQNTRFSLFSSLQQIKLSEAQSITTINQLDPAVPNFTAIAPQPMKSAGLAAIVGLMVAAMVVFLVAFLQDEIRDPGEFTRRWGVPVLGLITSYHTNGEQIITIAKPRMPVSEAFRSIRTNLQFSGIDAPLRSMLVTSASPSDGKTSVAANLATVFAQSEKDVVIIDADLRRPRLHKVFKLSNRIGLSDYFIRTPDRMTGAIKQTPVNGLNIVTSGSLPPNPSELLSSNKMKEVLDLLSSHYDMLIVDSPPLLAVTDALVLARFVDGVILVIDPRRSKRGAIRQAIEQLQRTEVRLLGVVLNNIKVKRSSYYYARDYYYSKQYGKGSRDSVSSIQLDEPESEEEMSAAKGA
jgi:capsular exopolysaccharide synthesis family protein